MLNPRQLQLLSGEQALRTHLPEDVPLSCGLVWAHENAGWYVVVKLHPEGRSIEIGREPLEEFPSELMIAQAMLVA